MPGGIGTVPKPGWGQPGQGLLTDAPRSIGRSTLGEVEERNRGPFLWAKLTTLNLIPEAWQVEGGGPQVEARKMTSLHWKVITLEKVYGEAGLEAGRHLRSSS